MTWRCSGASLFARSIIWDSVLQMAIKPLFLKLALTISERDIRLILSLSDFITSSFRDLEFVIRQHVVSELCSACDIRSTATRAGSADESATIASSVGPAII